MDLEKAIDKTLKFLTWFFKKVQEGMTPIYHTPNYKANTRKKIFNKRRLK